MSKPQLAGCIILDDAGKILLLHRNIPTRMQWETPGGKVDPGEEPHQTATRELKEELGVGVEIIREIGRKDFMEDDNDLSYVWYLAKITGGEPALMEPDLYDEFRYFTWEEMRTMYDLLSANGKNLVSAYFAKEVSVE
jgi:8-oxo-dGTP diphosphatase